jgi:Patatin-like phospholipase
MRRRLARAVVLVPLLCASVAFPRQPRKNPYVEDKYRAQGFPARGGSVDWGLALSGGGPRSALFSIGVMKALYDKGHMNHIDVISSTSGGSYALYWLLTGYDPSGGRKFGGTRFDNDVVLKEICSLQNSAKSNFFPNERILPAIWSGDRRFKAYEESIINSFGDASKHPKEEKIDFLNGAIEALHVPYFIINTRIGIGKSDVAYKGRLEPARVFEITPGYRGNPELKFRDWLKKNEYDPAAQNDKKENADVPPPLSKSVATSGIPGFVLGDRDIAFNGKTFPMWDGGQAENLAALGLITRGVANVIIVDSEQDAGYRFAAYKKLKELLLKWNIDFRVTAIEDFLKNPRSHCKEDSAAKKGRPSKCLPAVAEGRAKSNDDGGSRVNSNIFYIKMSNPEMVLPGLFSDAERSQEEEQRISQIFAKGESLKTQREGQRCPRGAECCDCANIKLDFRDGEDRHAFYAYAVKDYSDFLNRLGPRNKTKKWLKILPFKILGKASPFFSYNFPHTTTLDLTFYADQLEAFVGLGYLQAVEIQKL